MFGKYEVKCTCNEGFEDQLTVNCNYRGYIDNASITITNDNGEERTYGMAGKLKLSCTG